MSNFLRPARRHFDVGLVASVVFIAGLFAASSATAASYLAADFESGAPTGWSSTSHVQVDGAFARTGSYGARAVATTSQAAYLTWNSSRVTQGQRYGRISGWVRVAKASYGQSIDVITLQNAYGSRHFDFFREPWTGKWKYDLFSVNSAESTMPANIGQWYFVEALVDFGGAGATTYTAKVRIDGVPQPTITSTQQAGSTVKAAWFGSSNIGKTNTRDYDGLRLDVASMPLSFTR